MYYLKIFNIEKFTFWLKHFFLGFFKDGIYKCCIKKMLYVLYVINE